MQQITRRNAFLFLLCGILLVGDSALAQPINPGGNRILLDGVAAVVGNEVVLQSDVQQQSMMIAQENRLDPNDPRVQRDVLELMINEKLVLTRAQEDSLVIREEELTRAVDQQFDLLLERCKGSVECVERTYGMPIEKIKHELREILRQRYLVQQAKDLQFADLKLTENDVQEFYAIYKDSLPKLPEQVELQRIVLLSKPGPEAKAEAISIARSVTDSLKNGGDFGDFARRYSIDPGSAASGGDVGYVAKGRFVREYENAAAKLALNEISEPVESQYGIHIIQVLDRRGEETRSRHILIPIKLAASDRDSLVARLNDIRRRALGGEDFKELAKQYSQEEATRGLGGSLGRGPVDQMPAEQKRMLTGMKEGDITEPTPTALSPTETGYQIVRLARRIPPHAIDPTEDRVQLERFVLVYKQNRAYADWVAELRKEIYWEIKTNN